MLADDVRGRLGPDVIAPDDIPSGERLELGLRQDPRLDHLLRDHAIGRRPLGKLPRDCSRRHDRHPIHLRRRHAAFMDDVVQRLHAHHFVARQPWLDARRHAGIALQHPVEKDSVLRGRDAGDERGVIRPRDRRIDRTHAGCDCAARRQRAQRWHRQKWVIERPRRQTVETDENDMPRRGSLLLWRCAQRQRDCAREYRAAQPAARVE